jgi:hypothetical protein
MKEVERVLTKITLRRLSFIVELRKLLTIPQGVDKRFP